MFDAVLLDVMLPGKNGFEVARELRARGDYVPILMLTAAGRPEDVLAGLRRGCGRLPPQTIRVADPAGADAQAAASQRVGTQSARGTGTRPLRGLLVWLATRSTSTLELRAGTMPYHLTVMEADLLQYLLQNAGQGVSRKAILEDVWDLHEDTDTRAIDNFIVRLRRYPRRGSANRAT